MREVNVIQGSEAWEQLRARPTASQFGRIVTPKTRKYSTSAKGYQAEIIAKRLGVWREPPTTFAMDWGTDHEPIAAMEYETMTGGEVREAGFVFPDETDAFGCSPDRFVGDDGLLEIKCPESTTLIQMHQFGKVPDKYIPQIQGQLLITGREWCDFFAFYPHAIPPFQVRVFPDVEFQEALLTHLHTFLGELQELEDSIQEALLTHLHTFFGELQELEDSIQPMDIDELWRC